MKKLIAYMMFSGMLVCGLSNPLDAANNTSQTANEIVQITRDNLQEVLQSKKPVIIDVYTDWCGPCRALAPTFKQLNDTYGDRYLFAKLNGDTSGVTNQFMIQGYPTIIFLKDGQELGRHLGFLSRDQFIQKMHEYFEK